MKISDILPSATEHLSSGRSRLGLASSVERIVVILIDGMGAINLREVQSAGIDTQWLLETPAISATFPTTTPVSLASFGTGLEPGSHGFIGATMWLDEFGEILQPLQWKEHPHPLAVQPEPTWFEHATTLGIDVTRIGPHAYRNSGLTQAVLRGGQHKAAENLEELQAIITEQLRIPGRQLVYAYYPKLDKVGHVYGTNSVEWRDELHQVNEALRLISDSVDSRTAVLITADHGMVNVAQRVWMEDEPGLMAGVVRVTGEPRLRHVFIDETQRPRITERWSQLSDRFDVLKRDDFLAANYLGNVSDFVAGRVGDLVVMARDNNALCSHQIDSRVSMLIGQHGSYSESEVSIPFAVLAG
jgi:hypothetical protein